MFPSNNIWNTRIDNLPVHARSDQWVSTIGRNTGFHMDFGSGTWDGGPIGIPYNIVGSTVPRVPVSFYYPDESDPGPYPIPDNPLIEHGSDHHILIVDPGTCTLYELYDASYSGGTWHAGSGAIWNLNSNALRPDTWTSADAAGLPILPGLIRYDEIVSGEINHAIRFTAENTNGYIWPARHLTSNNPNTPQIPPMGARFRLKASYNISSYPVAMQIVLQAMKTYGIILADNGSNWYVSGAPDERWNNDMLHLLDDLTGNDFEAVDITELMIDNDSGATDTTEASTTFTDVPLTHMFWKYIEAFYDAGITTGCSQSPKKYCPLNNVTRGEMAVFVERAMGNFAPTPNPTGMFADVPYAGQPASFQAFIEEFYNDGITTGCTMNPLKYCPQNYVTRGEMAVFIERALGNFAPTPNPTGMFADVPYAGQPASFQAFIEEFYNDGITTGCAVNPLKYCPQNYVTRGEMAVFIVRAFGIPLP
ncbi:MAG: S-layer homology domain-containing protein [Chloroflexota bacterium]